MLLSCNYRLPGTELLICYASLLLSDSTDFSDSTLVRKQSIVHWGQGLFGLTNLISPVCNAGNFVCSRLFSEKIKLILGNSYFLNEPYEFWARVPNSSLVCLRTFQRATNVYTSRMEETHIAIMKNSIPTTKLHMKTEDLCIKRNGTQQFFWSSYRSDHSPRKSGGN